MILSPLAGALALDLLLADPRSPWHPVRLMGRMIAAADQSRVRSRLRGLALALGLPALWALAGWATLWSVERSFGPAAAWAASAVMIWLCVSVKDMIRHVRAVSDALNRGDLEAARGAVGMVVGRDTARLDMGGVSRAAMESLAESLCDGVVAPLFYAALGGAPAALAFKALSTLDSMVGYKRQPYLDFGWASARLDDLANYLPARISAALLAGLAAFKGRGLGAWSAAWKGGPLQPSPNSGWPEGAFAGALDVELGGPISYQGAASEKARLNPGGRAPQPADLPGAMRLFLAASLLAFVLFEATLAAF